MTEYTVKLVARDGDTWTETVEADSAWEAIDEAMAYNRSAYTASVTR